MEHNAVKHPAHYTEGRKYEPKDVIRDWDLNFNLGSALKYIARAGRKDDIVQDLKKAIEYLSFEVEAIQAERALKDPRIPHHINYPHVFPKIEEDTEYQQRAYTLYNALTLLLKSSQKKVVDCEALSKLVEPLKTVVRINLTIPNGAQIEDVLENLARLIFEKEGGK